jgi:hypothetical protein
MACRGRASYRATSLRVTAGGRLRLHGSGWCGAAAGMAAAAQQQRGLAGQQQCSSSAAVAAGAGRLHGSGNGSSGA